MWWMHAVAVDGLHWHWGISVKAIKILYWRRVVWIWTGFVPASMILKGFLVMVFVVHL